jgi:hypothetical protein
MKRERPKKYIASCSFGKDSIATILLALEHGEPLDRVVFAEVMFDAGRGISGEIPEHIEWIYGVAIPKLEGMGVKIDVVRSDMDYVCLCKKVLKRGKNAGKMYGIQNGFPCYANSYLKMSPIKDYYKGLSKDYDIVQYVGIAVDEPKRLSRLEGTNKVSLLAKYGYTEAMAKDKCKEYDLVSPCYSMSSRGGCWFCYNGGIERYRHIRRNHPELWCELKDLYISTASPYLMFDKTLNDVEREIEVKEWLESQPTLF